MSPLSNIWATNHRGGSTSRIPAEDLQLRVQMSRESDTTMTPTLDPRASSAQTLASPPPPSHHSVRQLDDDALGEFFGGQSHRTRTRQRAPPPYSPDWDGEKLPGYAPSHEFETDTAARHMFRYGFLFPVFWVIGVYFLFVPIRVSVDWQSDKTEEEKQEMLSEMRETEVKWSKRCLWALLSFFVCLAVLIVAVVLSRRR